MRWANIETDMSSYGYGLSHNKGFSLALLDVLGFADAKCVHSLASNPMRNGCERDVNKTLSLSLSGSCSLILLIVECASFMTMLAHVKLTSMWLLSFNQFHFCHRPPFSISRPTRNTVPLRTVAHCRHMDIGYIVNESNPLILPPRQVNKLSYARKLHKSYKCVTYAANGTSLLAFFVPMGFQFLANSEPLATTMRYHTRLKDNNEVDKFQFKWPTFFGH